MVCALHKNGSTVRVLIAIRTVLQNDTFALQAFIKKLEVIFMPLLFLTGSSHCPLMQDCVAAVEFDSDGYITSCSDHVKPMLGYEPCDLVGSMISCLFVGAFFSEAWVEQLITAHHALVYSSPFHSYALLVF